MGLFDDLQRALVQAVEAAREAAEAGQDAPPRAGSAPLPAARVRGRLQRQPLHRVPPAAPSMPPAEPSSDDFRRKVEAMVAGEPEAPGAPRFDSYEADALAPPPLTLSPRDMLRAILLGEVLDEPKGRRARRPHPR